MRNNGQRDAPSTVPASRTNPTWTRDLGQRPISTADETWRLFVALRLTREAIDEIGTFINGMPTMAGNNVRWTPRENVHLTLAFLGDTSVELMPDIQTSLSNAAANTSPFALKLGEPGAFPSLHAPKILWVGLEGEVRKLMQLQGRVEGALRTIGFEPERRPFKQHITVGRTVRDLTRQYAGDVGFSWRRSVLPAQRAEIRVDAITLLRSRLRSEGAIYEPIFNVDLNA